MKAGSPISRCRLSESNVVIVWPKASASVGVVLGSFIRHHRRTGSAAFVFVGHPVPGSVFRESEFLVVSGQDAPRQTRRSRERYRPLVSDVMDALITVPFLARTRRRYDLLISAGLNLGLLGILLRRLNMVRRVAFVVMDYWPQKYESAVWNWIYRKVYGWCSTRVDFVVDVAPTIEAARVRDGIRVHPSKVITIPHPIDPSAIGFLPQNQLEADTLVWSGALTPECGFELVIDAVELVAKTRSGVTVNVTSYAPFPDHLWRKIGEKGLEKHFKLLGYIKDEAEFSNTVRRFRAGLAPYAPRPLTVKRFAGVARPWTYMANGVPPIMTRIPPDAGEIEQCGAGMVIDYDRHQLASAILALLTDDGLHERCRERGLSLVHSRAPRPIFTDLLTRMGLPPDSEKGDDHARGLFRTDDSPATTRTR